MGLNIPLILAAIIPAVFLMYKVYRADRMEPEPPKLLISLVALGLLATLIALVVELVGDAILGLFAGENTLGYAVIENFIIVAYAEECAKFFLMKKRTWKHPAFDCRFDGIVYAVFISLGFALFENIGYVLENGFGTALVRAVTAVPGHCSFGVLMGVFYGLARGMYLQNKKMASKALRILAVVVPAFVHGAYDFIATVSGEGTMWVFLVFIVIMFVIAFFVHRKISKNDYFYTTA